MLQRVREYTTKIIGVMINNSPAVIYHAAQDAGGYTNLAYNIFEPIIKKINNSKTPLAILIKEIEENLVTLLQSNNLESINSLETKCANETKIDNETVIKLFGCVADLVKVSEDNKVQNLITCTGINPLNFITIMDDFSALSKCVAKEVKTTATAARKVFAQIKGEVKDFAEAVDKYKVDHYVKVHLQNNQLIASCAHNTGDSPEIAYKKMGCFIEMLEMNSGIAQRVQYLIKCDNLNALNAADELHNSLMLAQCISDKMETNLIGLDGTIN